MRLYILEGQIPVPCDDIKKCEKFYQSPNRQVAIDSVGNVSVSTVFLIFDHSFKKGPPVLFETKVFGGKYDDYAERCSTWKQAEEMHRRVVKMVLG
jgi:hypothetical protein